MPTMFRDIVRSLLALAALTVICGVAYPLVIWGVGQIGFSGKANGSLVHSGGRLIGSSLLGQEWKGAQWFHGRQSAVGYDANGSGGSNLGPNSAALAKSVKGALAATAKEDGVPGSQVPVDLVTSSASGLDPASYDRFVKLVRDRLKDGITICLIEHNLDIVHGISDRIAFLDQGTVLACGEPRAILNDPKLAAIYFGERR